VTGVLSTFSGTSRDGRTFLQRVLIASPETISVYCDSKGRPMMFLPIKGLGSQWPYRRSLADLVSEVGAAVSALSVDGGSLPSLPDEPDSDPTPDTRTGLKYLPDGARVDVLDRVVSATFPGFFYIEEPDRSSAIRVDADSAYPSPGDLVEIAGVMTTDGGERAIAVDSSDPTQFVSTTDNGYPIPRPLGMNNKAVGGGAVGLYAAAIGSSTGLNNTGTLVTAWGRVTTDVSYDSDGNQFYYIDDGSALQSEPGCSGIRIYDWTRWPAIGDYLGITGIASSYTPLWATTSFACLRAADYVGGSSGTGVGTVSGTVTAGSGASNRVARVYGTGGSTTCQLNGSGTGNYSMAGIPAGTHTFSADLDGYSRDTAKVTVVAGQTTTCNFTLAAAQASAVISAEPTAVVACTGEPCTISVTAYFESGTGCANAALAFHIDRGQFAAGSHTQDLQINAE